MSIMHRFVCKSAEGSQRQNTAHVFPVNQIQISSTSLRNNSTAYMYVLDAFGSLDLTQINVACKIGSV